MNVAELQAEALAGIAAFRPSGEALAIVPAYIGPWTVAALDAAQFLARHPGEQALFVYEHDRCRQRFVDYIAPLVADVTIVSPQAVKGGGYGNFAYVASPEKNWSTVRRALRPQFALRHSQTPAENSSTTNIVTMPNYEQAGGQFRLQWNGEDSIRYYTELYFGEGGPIPGPQIVRLARMGLGPERSRLYREIGGDLRELRAAAGLGDDVIYHRGMSVEQRVDLLKSIGDALGRTPSVSEIQKALREMNGPAYTTFVRGVGLPKLRELAGQDPGTVHRTSNQKKKD